MQLKSLGFVAVIKAVVAGEMNPKYAVDLSAYRYQSLDSKRVVSTRGQEDGGAGGGIPGANRG